MKYVIVVIVAFVLGQSSFAQATPILRIGLVADPQYENRDAAGLRYYRESLWKLKQAIDTFNYYQVDFVQNLGDIINDGWDSFDSIMPVYYHLNPDIENYHLLGNHDFAVDSTRMPDLLKVLSMPDFYYSYVKKNWRFIVLDATDCSYFANPLHHYNMDQIDAYYNRTGGQVNHYNWNAAIGAAQQKWLKKELNRAELSGQKVIIFSHMPIQPFHVAENLWNDSEIVAIIENSSNVVAFINGHNHSGNYAYENGIYYLTICGMVNTRVSSYGILEIYRDSLLLRGYGNQKSLRMAR